MESDNDVTAATADDLPPASLGALSITITDSPRSEEKNGQLAQALYTWAHELSRYLKLERLARIHIAGNYHAALAALRPGGVAPIATDNEHGIGAAMSVRVPRDDGDTTEIVIAWALIEHLEEETEDGALARYTLTHELAHAHEHRLQDAGTPGGVSTWRVANQLEQALLVGASGLLSEYSACRRSGWAAPLRVCGYLDMLAGAAIALDEDLKKAIEALGESKTPWSNIQAALQPVGFLYSAIGYAFGHWHGVRDTLPEADQVRLQQQVDAIFSGPHGAAIERAAMVALRAHDDADWTEGVAVYRPVMDDLARMLHELGF